MLKAAQTWQLRWRNRFCPFFLKDQLFWMTTCFGSILSASRQAPTDEETCKYSQFQHLTECARTHLLKTTPATKGLVLCLDANPGHQGTSVGPGQYPRYTDARKGRPWVAHQHHNSTTRLRHLHDTAARLSNTYMVADADLRSNDSLSQEPKRSGSDRKSRKRSQESPQENSEKHPGNIRNKSQDAEFDGAGYQEVDLG